MSSAPVPPRMGQLEPYGPISFTREDCARYAEASGDRNPIHIDRAAALAEGLPDCVVHGMLIAGQFERAIRHWYGNIWLAESATQFVRPLPVDRDVILTGSVIRRTPQNSEVTLRLVVRDADEQVICFADARVSLGDGKAGEHDLRDSE